MYSPLICKGFGLQVNLSKREIILMGCVANVEALAVNLRCHTGILSSSYLKLPLGATFKAKAVWDPYVQRPEKRSGP